MSLNLKTITNQEFIAPGRSGCPGCAGVLVARLVLKVLGEQTIMVSATGCVLSNFTHAGAPTIPFMHSLLPGAASLIAGIDSGLKSLGKRDNINLLAMAGDGGTADIGLQALSGASERGHKFLYVCYDNEGYMNTGGQRSGTTPFGAKTSTTTMGESRRGAEIKFRTKKDMVSIMAAHSIPYVATASIAYPQDLLKKIEKANRVDGPAYLHILTPCNYKWGFSEDLSIEVSKKAVETRVAPLLEIEHGRKYTLGMSSKPSIPVVEYLKLQSRFNVLDEDDIERIQMEVDANWEYLKKLAKLS